MTVSSLALQSLRTTFDSFTYEIGNGTEKLPPRIMRAVLIAIGPDKRCPTKIHSVTAEFDPLLPVAP